MTGLSAEISPVNSSDVRRRAPAQPGPRCCGGLVLGLLLAVSGCDMLDMYDQPRYEALEASTFFEDGKSARPPVAGTIPRGHLREDTVLYTGRDAQGAFVLQVPVDVNRALFERGRERFNIFCSVCHGQSGYGDGMIVQRGFRKPPSFHIDRLENAPAGHFYDVITNGFGAMPAYNVQIPPEDRWAIVAYVRALQLSQHATIDDVPAENRSALQEVQK